jgi:PAS domain S-box-containing protein
MPLSTDSLERLIEASPDIVVATDARGQVAYYNDGARHNLGYGRDEIIGRFVAQLYPDIDEARRVMAAMRDPAQCGKGRIENFPTTYVAKGGEKIPVAISGVILLDSAGTERGTIGFAKDLREIIRKDQLAVLGEIAVGLSHEINNPLAVITNQLSLLERFFDRLPSSGEVSTERRRIFAIRAEVGRIEANLERLREMAEQEEYTSKGYVQDARMIDLTPRMAPERPLAGRRILVVDDDAGVRETVAEILRADGSLVDTAADGEEALALLGIRSYDLVVSDVVMPGIDGYELFAKVREQCPETKMVLMTAYYYDKDHVIKRSRLKGLEGVLFKKPIDPARLRATVAELVAGRG